VKAFDADSGINAEITYNIVSESNSTDVSNRRRFIVDNNFGEIRLSEALTAGDVNSSYLLTVRATDAGTQPLSTDVHLCVTIVDRRESEDHLRLSATGSLRSITATLLGSGVVICALVVAVVCTTVVVVVRRRARSRRRRSKDLRQYKFVDVRNGTHDTETGHRENADDKVDDRRLPRTVIHTLDRSPRSTRSVDVATRRHRAAAQTSSVLKRYEPDGCNSSTHFDV